MSVLYDVFRATEEANKAAILSLAEPRPGGSLLDCGCNDGSFTRALGARVQAGELHGVEFIPHLARAASSNGICVSRANLNDGLPYPDDRFDVVHANQLIEHLHNTDLFLKESVRVLKPDGYCILSTNNLASWHNVISLTLGMQPPPMHVSNEVILGNRFDPTRGQRHPHAGNCHYRIFAYQGLVELCEYHGFQVEVPLTVGYYPLPPALARVAARLDRRHGSFLTFRLRPR